MAAAEKFETTSLVDILLEEQERLSAVERFAQRHAEDELPAQARYYRDLIPAAPPAPGQQYAFRVDLDACTGCKACVTACHNLNGLGTEETWRDVGLLLGGTPERPEQQTVTTACHHCEDPGCLNGCPVKAYEKDPITGIVRHLDDQCIGCQYCTLKCPYDVPKYDSKMGIVRKCDMCTDRLAVGEAPACVQGCPNEAISIQVVDVGHAPETLLPVAAGTIPDSACTRPTTRYVGGRMADAAMRPVDLGKPVPGHAHHPLSAMLVLTQLSVGLFVAELLLGGPEVVPSLARTGLGMLAALLGLGVANLHLGRPQFAFRVVLGLPTSWMSREIVTLGAFAGAAGVTTLCVWGPWLLPDLFASLPVPITSLRPLFAVGAAAVGAAAVFSSVMIYADTPRALWQLRRSAPLFFGTMAVMGLAGSLFSAVAFGAVSGGVVAALAALQALLLYLKLQHETSMLEAKREGEAPSLERSRSLLMGPLVGARRLRVLLAWAGGIVAPVLLAVSLLALPSGLLLSLLAAAMLLATAAGEWLERHLFFRACAPVGMPGR